MSLVESLFSLQNFKQRMDQKASMLRAKELERALKEETQRQREELKARQGSILQTSHFGLKVFGQLFIYFMECLQETLILCRAA
jgi:hypothetical protein